MYYTGVWTKTDSTPEFPSSAGRCDLWKPLKWPFMMSTPLKLLFNVHKWIPYHRNGIYYHVLHQGMEQKSVKPDFLSFEGDRDLWRPPKWPFMTSIPLKLILYVHKWIPHHKKWYISCITQGYWTKTDKTRIYSLRGRLWPLTTPKMTLMTLKKLNPMIFC